jgi:hypothetical protein
MKTSCMCFMACLLMTAAVATADVTVDGKFTAGEWGAPVKHVSPYLNGVSGVQQSVDLYWWTDANRVYGAIVGDPTLPSAFPTANVYVYSSGLSTRPDHTTGTYGDGDDVIIESGSVWHFSLNGPPWAGPSHPLTLATTGSITVGTDPSVTLAYDTANLVTEFSIDRSLLGTYDQFRYGGQLYAYEFNTGGDREEGPMVPSSVAPVPEPATVVLFGTLLAGAFGLTRARRKR